MIHRLSVVGVGLLGGSVAKAVRARGLAREIVGVGRDAARLEPARRDGTLDRVSTDLEAGVRDADFVVLATPVLTIEQQLPAVARAAGEGTLVTDVGSAKAAIVRTAERVAATTAFQFVGSHPMAGSERAGYAVARADLLEGATTIVTPGDSTAASAVKEVAAFWEGLGARVSLLDPATHDRVVAAISHLPHLVVFALMAGAHDFESGALEFAARGFRDSTRIAASDPVVWGEIFRANRDALLASVANFRRALGDLERLVAEGDGPGLEAWIARVKALREALA